MYKIYISEEKEKNLVEIMRSYLTRKQIPQYLIDLSVNRIDQKDINKYKKKSKLKDEYSKFRSSEECLTFLKELDINVCFYCNLNYILLNITLNHATNPGLKSNLKTWLNTFLQKLNIKESKFDGTLDHFYPKSIYPALSCNIYNFIPCCSVCNSQYKVSRPINEKYYPYIFKKKEQLDMIMFKQSIDDNYLSNISNSQINNFKLEVIDNILQSTQNDSFIELLNIHNRYNNESIKLEGHELITKLYAYENSSYYYLFKSILPQMNDEQINRIIFGTSLNNKSDYLKRPLSKLRRDLIEQHAPWLLTD